MRGQYKFDKIRESLLSHQSSPASEVVSGFAIVINVKASTCVVETLVEIVAEPRRLSRLCTKPVRFEEEALLS